MNAARLLAHYDRIADAPDAVPRVRRFILDLAVRGKLVPQDPNDEPAVELVKRIRTNRLSQMDGPTRRTPPPAILDSDIGVPFGVPPGWAWSRLGGLCSKTGSGSTPRGGKETYRSSGVPFIRSQNIYDDGLRFDDVAYIDAATHTRMSGTAVKPRDLLLNITGGSIGRCSMVPTQFGEANVSQHVAIIRVAVDGLQAFLHLLVRSPYFQAFVLDQQTGAGRGGLPKGRMDEIPVAIPPLAEQGRIVTKVDELMALCDQLEAARREREATRDRLASASLARLNAPDGDEQTFATHARFTLVNLASLTTRTDQIKQLRQTILNLAVRGKLVPQDPNDEPAARLLADIAATRKRLYAERAIPKPRRLPSIDGATVPYPLPRTWSWAMLGDLCYQVSDGPHFSPQYVDRVEGVPFLSTRNVRLDGFDLSSVKYVSRADHEEFSRRVRPEKGDIIYTKGGTTGIAKVNDLDFEFSVWVHLAVLRIEKEKLIPRYVEMALNSPHCYEQAQHYTQGTSNFDLGLTRMIKITVPLPPLAEQRRIVAKVDELMALCDRLESSLATGDDTRRRLLDALLAEALAPAGEA